jgi:hypothetical protein
MIDPSGNVKYPIKAISILKAHGKSAHDSQLIDGYAINLGRAAQVCVYVCVCVCAPTHLLIMRCKQAPYRRWLRYKPWEEDSMVCVSKCSCTCTRAQACMRLISVPKYMILLYRAITAKPGC